MFGTPLTRRSLLVVVMCVMYVGAGLGVGCVAIFLKIMESVLCTDLSEY